MAVLIQPDPLYNALSRSASVCSGTIAVAGGSVPTSRNAAEVYGCRMGWGAHTQQGPYCKLTCAS